VSSISQETATSFKQYFTTQNVQRILFEKIPDVEVTVDPLTMDIILQRINSYLSDVALRGETLDSK
ncbi:hypothetical protein, partial [Enterococcus mundtii]